MLIWVEEMVCVIWLSISYFLCVFWFSFSMLLYVYVIVLWLVWVCELLLESDEQMMQIVMVCGFVDQVYFLWVFYCEMGCVLGWWWCEWCGGLVLLLVFDGGCYIGVNVYVMLGLCIFVFYLGYSVVL